MKQSKMKLQSEKLRKLVGVALITAIIVVLQFLAIFVRTLFPALPFTVSLVLVPIVVGSALYGKYYGAWFGFVFGVIVLLTDSAFFLSYSIFWTIVIVLVKGTAAGLCAGLVYEWLKPKGEVLATFVSAVVCPVVNTAIFVLGGYFFLTEAIKEYMRIKGETGYIITFIFVGIVAFNFIFELVVNLILSPTIVRIVKMSKKIH